jgi:hypothetical protein
MIIVIIIFAIPAAVAGTEVTLTLLTYSLADDFGLVDASTQVLILDSASYSVPKDIVKRVLQLVVHGAAVYAPIALSTNVNRVLFPDGNAGWSDDLITNTPGATHDFLDPKWWRNVGDRSVAQPVAAATEPDLRPKTGMRAMWSACQLLDVAVVAHVSTYAAAIRFGSGRPAAKRCSR